MLLFGKVCRDIRLSFAKGHRLVKARPTGIIFRTVGRWWFALLTKCLIMAKRHAWANQANISVIRMSRLFVRFINQAAVIARTPRYYERIRCSI